MKLHLHLDQDRRSLTLFPPGTDIVIWAINAHNSQELVNADTGFFNKQKKIIYRLPS